ncbi:MAG: DUF362 domain-containing protein [Bryobacterales bacterium]|nr:DUF362 domain-containing protein [Bryobacterales bacterium]
MQSAASKQPEESMLASATIDAVPRVGIVLSSLKEAEEHDGTKLSGLSDPCPTDTELTPARVSAMLRKAMEFGSRTVQPRPQRGPAGAGRRRTQQASEDWVVVLITLTPEISSDLLLVSALIDDYATQGRGQRFTIAAGGPPPAPWSEMLRALAARHKQLRFDYVDLSRDAWLEVPAPRRTYAAKNPNGVYAIAKTIRECDRLISVAPLSTSAQTGIAVTVANYWWITPAEVYGSQREKLLALGDPVDVLTDLYLHQPAAYAIAGGSQHRDAQTTVRHNIVIAGSNAVAVDAVAAAVMGFDAPKLPLLDKLEARGFGVSDPNAIWTRGNEIEQARRAFQKPKGYL